MTALVVRTVPGDQLARHVTAYLHTLTPHTAKTYRRPRRTRCATT